MNRFSLQIIPYVLLIVVTIALAVISVGNRFGLQAETYSSPVMVILWALTAVSAIALIFKRRLFKRPVVFACHAAFALILVGALFTHLTRVEGEIHLRVGERHSDINISGEGKSFTLPEGLMLDSFEIVTYQASNSPADFVCRLSDDNKNVVTVSMNKPASIAGCRLLLKSYDDDHRGVTFNISRDPIGKCVTYLGYAILIISLVTYFFLRKTAWRQALKAVSALILLTLATPAEASVSHETADAFGSVAVYHNSRVCPMSALAHDFTTTVTGGATTIDDYDADDVLAGFLFDFGEWKSKPVIKIKNRDMQSLFGGQNRVSYEQFFDAIATGKINLDDKDVAERFGDDISRFECINMLVSGELLRIFPVSIQDTYTWVSPIDKMPADIDTDQWIFIRKYLGLLNEQVKIGDNDAQQELIMTLKRYQVKYSGDEMPTTFQLQTERTYISIVSQRQLPIAIAIIGCFLFLLTAYNGKSHRVVRYSCVIVNAMVLLLLTALIATRWFISGHIPMSNGFETMQLLAWFMALIGVFCRKPVILTPMCTLGSGIAMCVAALSGSGTAIARLQPVLNSPLLSLHVALVICAYALFFLMALTAVASFIKRDEGQRYATLNRVMLYPAVALLTTGIFVGAIWADVSWGQYWNWDPKEVWALITMIIYALPIHSDINRRLNTPRRFNLYMLLAFISVIVTYFGVNYILGGMHSYA